MNAAKMMKRMDFVLDRFDFVAKDVQPLYVHADVASHDVAKHFP